MERVALALSLLSFSAQVTGAGWIVTSGGAAHDVGIRVDWQYPWQLPPRLRNHCAYEHFTARPYCSGHCGSDYQFFYCSQASFGCCHFGRGYCDWSGLLRCSP
jgi:hypothetical protein